MKHLVTAERLCAIGHGAAMAFGLAGLILVLPHPTFIASLPPAGLQLFQWSMAQGGVAYIVLGAIAVALYLGRVLGWRAALTFFVPATALSLSSELLGTSTGFPFGQYHYLTGLGYKVAGLVPFTIPLSWFYMGAICYLMGRAGLEALGAGGRLRQFGAVAIGALLLTAWDLVLDPAMSQTGFPFWEFQEVGQFFGMPYRNLSGWMATGALYMAVAAALWGRDRLNLTRAQLRLPVALYLVNFAFGAAIVAGLLDRAFWVPVALSVLVGILPLLALWRAVPEAAAVPAATPEDRSASDLSVPSLEAAAK